MSAAEVSGNSIAGTQQPPRLGLYWLPGTYMAAPNCHSSLGVPGALTTPSSQIDT